MIVVNLYAGPGAGKSTIAAGVFSKLKLEGVNCELVTEYAKDVVWEKAFSKLQNQVYIFGKQYSRLFRLQNQVEVVVTDSPLILSIIYNRESNHLPASVFNPLVMECYGKFENLNYFIERQKKYNPVGRVQTEDEAKKIDDVIKLLLEQTPTVKFDTVEGNAGSIDVISKKVLDFSTLYYS